MCSHWLLGSSVLGLNLISLRADHILNLSQMPHYQITCAVHQSRRRDKDGVWTDVGCSDMVLIDNLVNPLACSQSKSSPKLETRQSVT